MHEQIRAIQVPVMLKLPKIFRCGLHIKRKEGDGWLRRSYCVGCSRMDLSTKTHAVVSSNRVRSVLYSVWPCRDTLAYVDTLDRRVALTCEQTMPFSGCCFCSRAGKIPGSLGVFTSFNAHCGCARSVYLICKGQKCTGFKSVVDVVCCLDSVTVLS